MVKNKAPRRREWDEGDDEGPGEMRAPRARAARQVASSDQGPVAVQSGIVLAVRGRDALVAIEGEVIPARPWLQPENGKRPRLAVGDSVGVQRLSADVSHVVSVEPRRTVLRRLVAPVHVGGAGTERVIAANVDQVVLVCSPKTPPFRPGLIDRYLVVARRDALGLVLCVNKADLGVPPEVALFLEGYAALGVDVLHTSTVTNAGLDALRERLEGRVSVLSGHSGVGKSSLLNALEPGLALRIGSVTATAAGQGKGRHTTSSAHLVPLSMSDTYVVDAPGIRAFGIGRMEAGELAALFPDVAQWSDQCAVHGCRHTGEPDCAVDVECAKTAFGLHRLESYRRLLEEAEG